MIYTDKAYDADFYKTQQDGSGRSAEVIVPIILSLFHPSSVLDVGCGVGTWLHAFAAHGVDDVMGIDGAYVPRDLLKFAAKDFREADLTELTSVGRRFDIACCLEVAEHLPARCAKQLATMLTEAAPVVVFSAAVPHQGGNGHINEQWQHYWAELFSACGYRAFDCIRPVVAGNSAVDWWYRQNTIVYCAEGHSPKGFAPLASSFEMDRVDPGMVNTLRDAIDRLTPDKSIRGSIASIRRDVDALRRGLARRLLP